LKVGRKRPTVQCLYSYAVPFLGNAAIAIKPLQGRLVVMLVIGKMVDAIERARDDLVKHGQEKTKHHNGGHFLLHYHRFRMSNVPYVDIYCFMKGRMTYINPRGSNYIGGHLTSFLHALPIPDWYEDSYLASNCLRNIPIFTLLEQLTNVIRLPATVQILLGSWAKRSIHAPLLHMLWTSTLSQRMVGTSTADHVIPYAFTDL
jgi:hypothetical protein